MATTRKDRVPMAEQIRLIIGVPIAWLMNIVTSWLTALNSGSRFVLGAVIGAMIAFDNGGPVNKTAALFVNGLNADGFFIPTSAKMCSGMTSPLGIAIATFLGGKKKWLFIKLVESAQYF